MRNLVIKKTVAILVFALLCTAVLPVRPGRSDETRDQLNQVNQQIDQQQYYLNQVKSKEKSIMGQMQALDKDIYQTQNDMGAVSNDINNLKASIRKTEQEISIKQEELEEKSDLLGQRLVYMYEEGNVSYLEVLLSATSIKDFLTRYDMLKAIMDQDVQLIDTINEERDELKYRKSNLEVKANDLEAKQAVFQKKQQDLALQKDSKKKLLSDVEMQRDEFEEALNELEQTSRQLEQIIRAKEAGNKGTVQGTGAMTWPAPGYTTITSPFGMRFHPILKQRKLHTGVDIAAPGGATIVAADSGTVILAQWTTGYGKTTIIDHGNGISTLYGHQEQWLVSEGDAVKKGQAIGRVDSTGWSTGNHLHFEVRVNGTPVDPMGYL